MKENKNIPAVRQISRVFCRLLYRVEFRKKIINSIFVSELDRLLRKLVGSPFVSRTG